MTLEDRLINLDNKMDALSKKFDVMTNMMTTILEDNGAKMSGADESRKALNTQIRLAKDMILDNPQFKKQPGVQEMLDKIFPSNIGESK